MLSSFLNILYSVGRGSANVNAGAIFSSYLVFDELHSRFLPGDRKEKESNLEKIFGKEWKKHDDGKCHVLISTQVIEVGINS